MGVDPVSLALIGSALFGAVQSSRKPSGPKPIAPPVTDKIEQDESERTGRRRRRGSMFGQAQNIVDAPLG